MARDLTDTKTWPVHHRPSRLDVSPPGNSLMCLTPMPNAAIASGNSSEWIQRTSRRHSSQHDSSVTYAPYTSSSLSQLDLVLRAVFPSTTHPTILYNIYPTLPSAYTNTSPRPSAILPHDFQPSSITLDCTEYALDILTFHPTRAQAQVRVAMREQTAAHDSRRKRL